MLKRSMAGAVLLTMLSATAAVAQDFGFQTTPRITRPNGVTVGLLRPSFSGADAPDAGARTGFIAGVRSSQQLRPGVIVEAGLGVASRGATESSSGYSATTRITSVEVPVIVRFGAGRDGVFGLPQRISLFAGAQADVNVACKQEYKSSGYSSSNTCVDEAAHDVAAVVGAGFATVVAGRPFIIDAVFTNGFVAVFKDLKVFNRSLGFRMTMPFVGHGIGF